jgi:leader peptidase (prepilin peptidase)/N-methyltransferase
VAANTYTRRYLYTMVTGMGDAVELMNGWILPVIAAPFIGSFLGVVVRRLPERRPIARGRSCCEACGATLGPAEMVPLFSYVVQRGRCRHCGAPIAPMHFWIEAAALAVAVSAAWAVPGGPFLWAGCVLGWCLLTLAWIDARTLRLPDVLTLPLILAGLLEAIWLEPEELGERALAAAAAYTVLFLLAWSYRLIRKREGLGMGDAKLLAACGAWLGLPAVPWVAVGGALLALMWAAVLRLRGTRLTAGLRIPFGPFLAAAFWVAWLIGP